MTSIPSTAKVVVFGSTGPIGTTLIQKISGDHPSWTIHAVTRNPSSSSVLKSLNLPNVTMVQGDPLQKESVMDVTKDCDLMYCCVGFERYERKYWEKNWPIVADNLLSSIVSSSSTDETKKRKLAFCDNIYAYGPGLNISPHTKPIDPTKVSSKPAIRAKLRQQFEKHMKECPGTLTVVGGADFFGPLVTKNSFLGDMFTGVIVDSALAATATNNSKDGDSKKKKKTVKASVTVVGSCDKIHDFCFSVDFANALAIASINDKAYDKFWICPHAIHNKTLREIATDVADIAFGTSSTATTDSNNGNNNNSNKPIVQFTVIGTMMLYILAPFIGFMGELIEMKEFWTNDYTVNDTDFCNEFDVTAAPYKDALTTYIEFYKHEKTTAKTTTK